MDVPGIHDREVESRDFGNVKQDDLTRLARVLLNGLRVTEQLGSVWAVDPRGQSLDGVLGERIDLRSLADREVAQLQAGDRSDALLVQDVAWWRGLVRRCAGGRMDDGREVAPRLVSRLDRLEELEVGEEAEQAVVG